MTFNSEQLRTPDRTRSGAHRPHRSPLLEALPVVLVLLAVLGVAVGVWQLNRSTASTVAASGGPALASRTTFFADGSARIVVPDGPGSAGAAYDARYTVSGDTALTLSDGRTQERFRLRITADSLVLESPETGIRQTFVRVAA